MHRSRRDGRGGRNLRGHAALHAHPRPAMGYLALSGLVVRSAVF